MQQILTRRSATWLVAILVTAWLTWQAYQGDSAVVAVNSVPAVAKLMKTEISASSNLSNELISDGFALEQRTKATKAYFNLFATPAAPIQKINVLVIKPPTPVAPALPYKYMGTVTSENQTRVILLNLDEVLAVKVGDNIGLSYKLISINRVANSTELLFLYLPLNIAQTMVVRDVPEQ
jgi:hypothetical protein